MTKLHEKYQVTKSSKYSVIMIQKKGNSQVRSGYVNSQFSLD